MQTHSYIGPSISIKGDVSAEEPLTIAGRVDGAVKVTGHTLTIGGGGHVDSDLTADVIVIDGHASGSVSAAARIVVRETAQVDGTLSAPTISVAEGATIHGRVEAEGRRGGSLRLAS